MVIPVVSLNQCAFGSDGLIPNSNKYILIFLTTLMHFRSKNREGGRGISKTAAPSLSPPIETLKYKKNYEFQLCQNAGKESKIYNNQANTKLRKKTSKR